MGNKGEIGPGELQWMTSGKGIYHQEMPKASDVGYQGFQFWVNLPRKEKLVEPSYKYITKDKMKSYNKDGVKVDVISGNYKNIVGPIDKSKLGISMFHVSLEKGASIELTREKFKEGYIFVFEGVGALGKDIVELYNAYTLFEGEFLIEAKSKMQFIFAEGTPLKEPIYWKGPIVMNTREEIEETFNDLQNGTFI
jgi:redox-sensitive bicupin YhaK (pirin superfamily)